ncbi:MAG TPA: pyruvate:ferredoxin (flavodoxin) oxidoreductase [Chloroflexi bacterium]|nr:pyruvate:ferredoxin (flavodoxin) oxidoreductase [Chloroflexota bacterium]
MSTEVVKRQTVTIDGNTAAADIAHATNEVIAIYPITPSSGMGEMADEKSAKGQTNIWGSIPTVMEMQSEGGAAGAIHGALTTGSLTTTFTASQGLLLMLPNMYKIAGELTSTVFHISARSLAAQALSIFGDHSDVMATRATGWSMLFANSVQEVADMALIAQAATLESRVPFLHIFDGFRTSHEVMKVEMPTKDDMRAMIDDDLVRAHRARGMTPDRPVLRGTAQNPDVFFQARETVNPYYLAAPDIVQKAMDKFAAIVGRQYHLFDYVGAPDAERVIALMGSGAEAVEETVNYLLDQGEKVGMLKVRLYRPFSIEHFIAALPKTVKAIAALDRTKEPGSAGEPLYQDLVTAISETFAEGKSSFEQLPRIIGGRYGLSSKEFTPAMVKGIFDEMTKEQPRNHFTIGINDDVTHTSLDFDPSFDTEPDDMVRAMFWGLGSDGTVGANKNSIKIIGEETPNYAQGYFVYDSKKSGARTISHLRFGPNPIHSTYLIHRANFVAVHQFVFLERYNVLDNAAEGAIFLLNSPYGMDEVWNQIPRSVQEQIIEKKLKLFVIDAAAVAKETGMGARINTIMQTCFFAISGVLPQDEAIDQIKYAIKKTYGKRGEIVVRKNYAAVDAALAHLHEIAVPDQATGNIQKPPPVPAAAPEFVQNVTAKMIAGDGDMLPVSALPIDGTYPTGTTQWEKRNIGLEVPVWETDLCIQCGKCVMVCPHAVIRSKVIEESALEGAPESFLTMDAKWRELKGQKYTLQVAVEDCTGCTLCVEVCPAADRQDPNRKAINMRPQLPLREEGRRNWDFFLNLPEIDRIDTLKFTNVKNSQLLEPLFEFSGACPGCGETPYISLVTRLFGDRAIVANATGCSSIYGGNLPTTPWSQNKDGRGPAWSNSLFEDNAEFGLGMRLTVDKQSAYALELVERLRDKVGDELADGLLSAEQSDEAGIVLQRERVEALKAKLADADAPAEKDLLSLADMLVKKSVWIVGGDGWAYDIGYGGLDHVLASGRNVNVLVLDTEVYSNTGGQSSKATPLGAVAKFAASGKPNDKKDLGMMAMSYGTVYVAQIAMGASDSQTMRAILEAEAYDGPSLIIAYSHCIAHGYDMGKGLDQQKLAAQSGYWPLYRYNPELRAQGKKPLKLDSKAPRIPLEDYMYNENRFRMLTKSNPERAKKLLADAQKAASTRWHIYEQMAQMD